MKTRLVALMLVVNLAGCVGFTFSRDGDPRVILDERKLYGNTVKHDKVGAADRINPDGSETYVIGNEKEWCGLTIWAIIPIPLWMPLCHYRREVTYNGGRQVQFIIQRPATYFAVCGLFVPVISDSSFCTMRDVLDFKY